MNLPPLPWLFVAVPREYRAFERNEIATVRRNPTAITSCIVDDIEFFLGETGVGGASVCQTLDWLAQSETPRFVFLAGFAGALADDLRVGDGVLASGVVDPGGTFWPATLPLKMPYRIARLLTSDHLIATPSHKLALAKAHGAVAVDMETSYVAEWCERHSIPWACVRVVSDDVRTSVSKDVFDLLENGRVSPWRLTKAIVCRPSIVRELMHLQRSTRLAAETIAAALTAALHEV